MERRKTATGQIRRIGVSYHGNTQNFIALLDAYDWDFCQVQYNYMNEYSQAVLCVQLCAQSVSMIPFVKNVENAKNIVFRVLLSVKKV